MAATFAVTNLSLSAELPAIPLPSSSTPEPGHRPPRDRLAERVPNWNKPNLKWPRAGSARLPGELGQFGQMRRVDGSEVEDEERLVIHPVWSVGVGVEIVCPQKPTQPPNDGLRYRNR